MAIKYSKNFERDYNFYLINKDIFTFSGTAFPTYIPKQDDKGKNAKECFYMIESNGKDSYFIKDKSHYIVPCKEAKLLEELLLCKAGINFQIKQWAEGRADGTLSLDELSKRKSEEIYPEYKQFIDYSKVDIEEMYKCPEWVIEAVENQKRKLWLQ